MTQENEKIYLVGGYRTPIGKFNGQLSGFSGTSLGGFAIEETLKKIGVPPEDIDYIFMGQVLQAGAGQITARQAAVKGGIPMDKPATTVNKVCLSGLNAIYLAAQMIKSGDASLVIAGGMESMTNAPYLLPNGRNGYRMGDGKVIDSMMYDGLFCAFDQVAMGMGTENYLQATDISRADQDAFAALSHERAANATKENRLKAEIVPVEIPQKKSDPLIFEFDEGIRPETTLESLSKLRPAFTDSGTITAGNASQISDGGCAVLIAPESSVSKYSLEPLAEIVEYGQVAGPDASLLLQPANATKKALAKAGKNVSDVDLFEINEAFAAVAIASMRDLGISQEVVNVNGGAIALGHPIGMSGARLALTLAHELKRNSLNYGVASLCGGGGQGDAILLKNVK